MSPSQFSQDGKCFEKVSHTHLKSHKKKETEKRGKPLEEKEET